MESGYAILIAIVVVLFIAHFITLPVYLITKGNEKSKYKKMINRPTDENVIQYISAFQASYNPLSNYASKVGQFGTSAIEDKMRQAQGCKFILDCDTVSVRMKKELYNAMAQEGIFIK